MSALILALLTITAVAMVVGGLSNQARWFIWLSVDLIAPAACAILIANL
jgi:hypothetical protein